MVELLENAVTLADVATWYAAKKEIRRLTAIENLLRPKIFKNWFPTAEEGTNTSKPFDDTGYVFKGQRIIQRDFDMGAVDAFRKPLEGKNVNTFQANNINIDDLIRVKYELKVAEYRKLTAEELKIVDQCLVIKDGMCQLDIVPPSTRGQKAK